MKNTLLNNYNDNIIEDLINYISTNISIYGKCMIRISGDSMVPSYSHNQSILIKKSNSYNIGDVVVIKRVNRFIVHRIIDVMVMGDKKFYLTKGDNNTFVDRWFRKNEIVAKVVGEGEE